MNYFLSVHFYQPRVVSKVNIPLGKSKILNAGQSITGAIEHQGVCSLSHIGHMNMILMVGGLRDPPILAGCLLQL